ncbi:MAG: IS200/IS605 family transposase [Chitinophagales bacterium]|nr:IS200/IS605 family transposase [Chitinophagales bacterium]
MANTYSQINIHAVFAVKRRQNFITNNFRDQLHKHIAVTLKNDGSFPLAVGGWLDHVHAFFELPVTMKISDQVSRIKSQSSLWINEHEWVKGKFQWQTGYAAFSYSRSQRNPVIKYIMNQEAHHRKQTFREEYLGLLDKFQIAFDGRYVFEFYD